MRPGRVREKFVWQPTWDGPIKAWSIKFIKKNQWRCDRIHEFDDLLQDAYATFLRIEARYPRVIEPAHFMSLYKRAMNNEMHDRARYMGRKHVVHEDTLADVSEFRTARIIGEVTNAGYLGAALAELPDEMKLALAVLGRGEPELRAGHHRHGPRENLNMRIRRVLGFDKCRLDVHRKLDVTSTLKALLS